MAAALALALDGSGGLSGTCVPETTIYFVHQVLGAGVGQGTEHGGMLRGDVLIRLVAWRIAVDIIRRIMDRDDWPRRERWGPRTGL